MPSAKQTVTIARPVAAVFAYVADGENGPHWRSADIEVHRVSGEGVGTRYSQVVPGPMGRRIAADYEITTYEPNRRVEFQTTAGPVRPNGSYDFEAEGDGTRLTFSLDAKLGGIQKLLMSGMVQKTMDAEVGSIQKLKRVLEG